MQDNSPGRGLRWLGPLAGPVDRFLSGGKSSDPLYLSNQTLWQKSRRVILMMFPLAAVTVVIALSSFNLIKKKSAPANEIAASEVAALSLPDFSKATTTANPDVSVLAAEVTSSSTGPVLSGSIRNNTDRRFAVVEVDVDTTDNRGSQLGMEKVVLESLGPQSTLPFRLELRSRDAAFVVVKKVRTR
jgi:hypothetical protein